MSQKKFFVVLVLGLVVLAGCSFNEYIVENHIEDSLMTCSMVGPSTLRNKKIVNVPHGGSGRFEMLSLGSDYVRSGHGSRGRNLVLRVQVVTYKRVLNKDTGQHEWDTDQILETGGVRIYLSEHTREGEVFIATHDRHDDSVDVTPARWR